MHRWSSFFLYCAVLYSDSGEPFVNLCYVLHSACVLMCISVCIESITAYLTFGEFHCALSSVLFGVNNNNVPFDCWIDFVFYIQASNMQKMFEIEIQIIFLDPWEVFKPMQKFWQWIILCIQHIKTSTIQQQPSEKNRWRAILGAFFKMMWCEVCLQRDTASFKDLLNSTKCILYSETIQSFISLVGYIQHQLYANMQQTLRGASYGGKLTDYNDYEMRSVIRLKVFYDSGMKRGLSSWWISPNCTALMSFWKNVTQDPKDNLARAPHHSPRPKVLKSGLKFPYPRVQTLHFSPPKLCSNLLIYYLTRLSRDCNWT